MDRQTFLAQTDVQGFIAYLKQVGTHLPIWFNIRSSPFADENLRHVVGFDQVLANYQWRSAWTDWRSSNRPVTSLSFEQTHQSLSQLRERLQTAMRDHNQQEAYQTCRAILQWGGVDRQGTIDSLNQYLHTQSLIDYLKRLAAVVDADSYDRQQLTTFEMNSGWTKIAALASQKHVPIYDSRVGAAISWLYHRYRQQHPQSPQYLKFLAGLARGNQIRNPAQLSPDYQPQRVLGYDSRSTVPWIIAIIELNWLMDALLLQVDWLSQFPDLTHKKHAFEAVLFMIGYDLRSVEAPHQPETPRINMLIPPAQPVQPSTQPQPRQQQVTWVPTSNNVGHALQNYLNDQTRTHDDVVLKELGVAKLNKDTVRLIAQGGPTGFQALLATGWTVPHINRNQRQQVCLVDAWIVGLLHPHHNVDRKIEILIKAGFAGTNNSAGTLLRTGRNFGRFFGLLNANDMPTPLFLKYKGHFEQITQHLMGE